MSTVTFTPRPPSLRSRVAAVATSMTLRPIATAMPANGVGIACSRGIIAGSMRAFGSMSRGTTVTSVVAGGVKAEWVRAAGVADSDTAIFYVHGSGYALCSLATHRRLVSQLSALTGLPVLSVEYRLAPEHRFPAAADDIALAWQWLRAQGYAADRVVAAGDSAGGHLVLDLALDLLRSQGPMPAALALLSPVADLTFGLAAERERVRRDPMISARSAAKLCGHYTQGSDPLDARLRHVVAAHEALPPTLVQAGGAEILSADAHHIHQMLTAAGTDCRLEVWPGQMHVFQALPRLVPEATPALTRTARFLTEALAAPTDVRLTA